MPPTVNARVPLSLLEAVRRIDTPESDPDTEYVQELRNKRLGLSDTVYQQIRRYSDAAKRGQMIPYAEATGLATLIGRRPDAEALFVSAGQILANDVYSTISLARRRIIRVSLSEHHRFGHRKWRNRFDGVLVLCFRAPGDASAADSRRRRRGSCPMSSTGRSAL